MLNAIPMLKLCSQVLHNSVSKIQITINMDLPILYVKESQVEISIFKLFAFWVHVIVYSYSFVVVC